MITEKSNIKCEAIFSDDHTHRYLWKRQWDKEKPIAAIIMLNPCLADSIIADTTTSLVINNVARLEKYGGIEILNLFSLITKKLSFRYTPDEELNHDDNDKFILKAAAECDVVILAWGKAAENNLRISERVDQILSSLEQYKEKLFVISDGERSGLHPLTPSIRSQWILKNFAFPDQTMQEHFDPPCQ